MEDEKYLVFRKRDEKHIGIWDKNNQYLGALEKIRVGAWMTWCLTDIPEPEVYFTASCQDEIREKVKELNSKK